MNSIRAIFWMLLMGFASAAHGSNSPLFLDLELLENGEVLSSPDMVVNHEGGRFTQGLEQAGPALEFAFQPKSRTETNLVLELTWRFQTPEQGLVDEGNRTLELAWDETRSLEIALPGEPNREARTFTLLLTPDRITPDELERLRQDTD